MGKGGKARIHVVSYTHWDREFRFDFETTRTWLVRLWDCLLETMERDPGYRHYTLDGQFVLVDDYLEIRPEQEERIRRLAAEGRLRLGPWYTLPDSSSIHGESLVRNLATGLGKARAYGGAMELGYNVFSFGQIAQLPQIYAGFGIDFIFFYKHMNRARSRFDEFAWEAPDGTRAWATRLGREGRWNFLFAGHIPIVYGLDPWHKDWQYRPGTLGAAFHLCEPEHRAGFHFITRPLTSFDRKRVRDGLERTLATVSTTAVPEHLLFWDGTDFTEPHPLMPEIIRAADEEAGDAYEVVHSTLDAYAEAVKPLLADRGLDVVTGEMKDGPVGAIQTDVCSVHPALKRANTLAESRLFHLAEPLAAAAWAGGAPYPARSIERALRYLFLSQAHDSLHGVGPAGMCEDIGNRLRQAGVIAENVAVESMRHLAADVHTAGAEEGEVFLTVFNGCAFPRSGVVEACIDVPREANVDALSLLDPAGRPVPVHLVAREEDRAAVYHPRSRNMPFYVHRFQVLFEARDIPAVGYKTFRVAWTERSLYPYPHEDWDPLAVPFETLGDGSGRRAVNEWVALAIADDGTLELTNRATGRVHRGLNYFVDAGESGNLYFHRPPAHDRVLSTRGGPAQIACTLDSPLEARFEVETVLRLPDGYDRVRQARGAPQTDVPVRSEITLRRDSPVVEIVSTVDNRVRDHFLRIGFDTGLKAEVSAAGGVFDVNEYAAAPTRDGAFRGQELARHQLHGFVSLSDGKDGLTLLSDALSDYEVTDPARGVFLLSFVRGVPLRIPVDNRKWVDYPGDESAQSPGRHTARYGLLVHAGGWQAGGVLPRAAAFRSPLRVAQIGRQQGTRPCEAGFLELRGDGLVLSACKKADEGDDLVVRLFNPTADTVEGELVLGGDVTGAARADLLEAPAEALAVREKRRIPLRVGAKKIITVRVAVERRQARTAGGA